MSTKPSSQKKCETLRILMVRLPKRYGLSLKEAGRLSQVNLYKYKNNGTFPLTLSLYSYGEAFKIDPDWMIRIACLVESNQLTEDQALELLYRWMEFKPIFESAIQIVLNSVIGKLNK
jgi:hypothetical protein